jgi:N-acyl-D-aspartate/D-glutamate deacylase
VYPWPFAAISNALSLFSGGGSYDERVHGRIERGMTIEKTLKELNESDSWKNLKNELIESWEAEDIENERRRKLLMEKSSINAPRTRPINTTPVIAYSETHPDIIGLNFQEVAEALNFDDWVEALRQVIIDDKGFTYLGTTMTNEDDRKYVISQPWTMFESDSGMVDECPPSPMLKPVHPRASACIAMILEKYVRKQKILTLEEAIRKMTSLTAQWHGIHDRGLIRKNIKADITIFNPGKIKSNSTYSEPCKFAEGVEYVLVNGVIVYEKGKFTGNLPGKVLKLEN